MTVFGCDFMKTLNKYVVLPHFRDEKTVFTQDYEQREPFTLRDKNFEFDLVMAVDKVE